jgi:hypothetical protein
LIRLCFGKTTANNNSVGSALIKEVSLNERKKLQTRRQVPGVKIIKAAGPASHTVCKVVFG